MATIAKLAVELSLKSDDFTNKLESSQKKLNEWGKNLRGVGSTITGKVTLPLVAAGGMLTKWSSDLEQNIGATEHLWKNNSGSILAWAKSADMALGMTQSEALTTANRLQTVFNTMGLSLDESEAKTKDFAMRFADISAMMGGSATEVSEAFTSGLMGNYQALDKYGVNINAAMVEKRALEMTGKDLVSQLSAEEKQLAYTDLFMEKTASTAGQFNRESKTTAGILQRLRARAINLATAFGTLLLPYVNKLMTGAMKLVEWLEKLSDTQRKWVVIIAAIAAAIGPVIWGIGLLVPGISALITVIMFLLSPVGLIIVAIALLAAGLAYAYFHFETFRNIVNTVARVLWDVAVAAFDAFVRALEPVKQHVLNLIAVFTSLIDFVKAVFAGDWGAAWEAMKSVAVNAFTALVSWVTLLPSMLMAAFGIDISSLAAKGAGWISGLWDGAVIKSGEFMLWIAGLSAAALEWIGDTSSTLLDKGSTLINGMWDGAKAKWDLVGTWLSTILTLAVDYIGNVASTLTQKGKDLLNGLRDGAKTAWSLISVWVASVPTLILDTIGIVTSTLKQKGIDIIVGFFNGIIGFWPSIYDWFTGLGDLVVSTVGSLASTLWDAGWNLMWGLAEGIYSGASSLVSAAVNSVANLIPGWLKGPLGINSPSRVFMEIGRWIPAGLAIGIENGVPLAERAMSSFADGIAGASFSSPSFAGVPAMPSLAYTHDNNDARPIIIVQQVTPQALIELMDDASVAATFAKNFASELSMMEG